MGLSLTELHTSDHRRWDLAIYTLCVLWQWWLFEKCASNPTWASHYVKVGQAAGSAIEPHVIMLELRPIHMMGALHCYVKDAYSTLRGNEADTERKTVLRDGDGRRNDSQWSVLNIMLSVPLLSNHTGQYVPLLVFTGTDLTWIWWQPWVLFNRVF